MTRLTSHGGSIVARKSKRLGCLLLGLAGLVAWAIAGWALWLAALNAPMPEKSEESTPFEFIPSSEGN